MIFDVRNNSLPRLGFFNLIPTIVILHKNLSIKVISQSFNNFDLYTALSSKILLSKKGKEIYMHLWYCKENCRERCRGFNENEVIKKQTRRDEKEIEDARKAEKKEKKEIVLCIWILHGNFMDKRENRKRRRTKRTRDRAKKEREGEKNRNSIYIYDSV